jgi:chemotaxis protein CheX
MELKQALVDATFSVLPMFGVAPEYVGVLWDDALASAAEVNVQIGLVAGLRGSVVIELPETLATRIVSGMMGGMPVGALDDMAISALGEMGNMLTGMATMNVSSEEPIQLSPPTLAIGKEVFLLLSQVKSGRHRFKAGGEEFHIAFSLE